MSKKRIPKQDRAFLYFRENSRGYLNIKFGPDKYSSDTKKFYEVLMVGVLQSITFLANVGKDQLTFEEHKENYETIRQAFQAVLFEAFPEVKKKIDEELAIEEEVIKVTEEGKFVPVEDEEAFQKAIEETKTSLKGKSSEVLKQKDLKLEIEKIKESLPVFEEILERIQRNKGFTQEQRKVLNNIMSNVYLSNVTTLERLEAIEDK